MRHATTGPAVHLARDARRVARAALPAVPGNRCGPSLRARAGGGFSATLCNQAGGAGAGMGLPGPGAESRRGGRRGSELARSLRDVWAPRPLLLPRTRWGRMVRGRAAEVGEVCGGRAGPCQALRGWSGGVGGPERRHAPGAGLLRAGAGDGWKYHPSLPARPFLCLRLLKKPPLLTSPQIPERCLFLPLALFHDLMNPNPRDYLPCTPLSFCFTGSSQSSAHSPRTIPLPHTHTPCWSGIPGNTAPPFLEVAQPNPRLSRPPKSALTLHPPRTPDGYSAAARALTSWKRAG